MLSNCGVGEDSWVPWTARRSHQPIYSRGNQPWIFTGRTAAEAEAPILWPPDMKSQLTGKDPGKDAGKDWGQEEKGVIGWDGWMVSLTQWMWVWANSRREWRTGKPGMLQSVGLQSRRRLSDWTTTMFIAPLLLTTKKWKSCKYPLKDGWINKRWELHTMEY